MCYLEMDSLAEEYKYEAVIPACSVEVVGHVVDSETKLWDKVWMFKQQ